MEGDVSDFARIAGVIAEHRADLDKAGVLSARPGFEAKDGWVTRSPAIVVTVNRKVGPAALVAGQMLPDKLGGFPVDVRQASALKKLQVNDPQAFLAAATAVPPESRLAEFPNEVRVRDLSALPSAHAGIAAAAKKTQIPYTAPAGVDLHPVAARIPIRCSVSPDSGWETLKSFLAATTQSLTVGMYDFTSRHVLDQLTASLAGAGKTLQLVLDQPPLNDTEDQPDQETRDDLITALGDRARFAWALDDRDKFVSAWIYPSAYHIKVAVRDSSSFWLSSGNWNNSNQPDLSPTAAGAPAVAKHKEDRDWHVVIDHAGLARTFEAYLKNDFDVAAQHQLDAPLPRPINPVSPPTPTPLEAPGAQTFPAQAFTDQMTIQPVLTPDPDGYVAVIVGLIESATERLYLQYQYAHAPTQPGDTGLAPILAAVAKKQAAGVDVKVIFSEFETIAFLEQLKAAGINTDEVKIQPNVHNKGIVVDSRAVLVSSQNWSTSGVERNRDAGVVITHDGVAQYFEAVFLDDWNHRSKQVAVD